MLVNMQKKKKNELKTKIPGTTWISDHLNLL